MMLDTIMMLQSLLFTETPEAAIGPTQAPQPVPDSAPQQPSGITEPLPSDSGATAGDTVDASTGQSTETTIPPVAPGAQIPTETQTIRLNDGAEISIDEARDGYLRQADYTQKTQQLAEQRRQLEAQERQNQAWHNYYQERSEQQEVQPQQPVAAPFERVQFNEEDYATEMERKLATELNTNREMLAQVNKRLQSYDTRLADADRQRVDDHVANEINQWTAQFNVTEAEILELHHETGVSNVKVLAEMVHHRKQGTAQQRTTQVQQVVTAAEAAHTVTQTPQAAPQQQQLAIDYSLPVSKRIPQLIQKYPNI